MRSTLGIMLAVLAGAAVATFLVLQHPDGPQGCENAGEQLAAQCEAWNNDLGRKLTYVVVDTTLSVAVAVLVAWLVLRPWRR